MFHVKHSRQRSFDVAVNESFTNAKIAKYHVQNIFDIDSASESAERRRRRAQFLGDQLLAAAFARARPIKRRYGLLQAPDDGGLGSPQPIRSRRNNLRA